MDKLKNTKKNKKILFGSFIINILKSLDCKNIYGYQGGAITDFIDLIDKDNSMKYINCRSESNAALSAFSEAKLNITKDNSISCCISTSGPGASNLLTGIIDSNLDKQRVIFITGAHELNDISLGEFQNIRQDFIFYTSGLEDSYLVDNIESGVMLLKKCISNTLKFNRPCHLCVPKNFFNKEIKTNIDISFDEYYLSNSFNDFELCQKIIDYLIKYNTSIILGIDSLKLDKKLFEQLLSILNLPIFFRSDAYRCYNIPEEINFGIAGIYGENRMEMAIKNLKERELSLCIGVIDPAIHISKNFHVQDLKLIELNPAFESSSDYFKKEIYAIIGYRNNTFLENMIKTIKEHPKYDKKMNKLKTNYETIKNQIFNEKKNIQRSNLEKRYLNFPISNNTNHCDTGIFMSQLSNYVNDGDTISIDTGEHQIWFSQYFKTNKDIRILTSEHMGTMGFGLCSSLSNSINCPSKNSFVVVGDGGFQFSLNELATIQQHGKGKVIIILINNGVLARVKYYKSHTIQKGCDIYGPDFIKLTESYGGKGFLIEHNSDISKIGKALQDKNKICLLNVIVDPKLRFFD